MRCIFISPPHWFRWWERGSKVLNRTLKLELQEETSQTSASSLHHLVGCVLASKKFWRLLQGSGREAKRSTCRGGIRWFIFPVALLGLLMMLTRMANWLFLIFQGNIETTTLFWEGSGRAISAGGGQVAGSTFERKVNMGYVVSALQPCLYYHILWLTREIRIQTFYLKITGHLSQNLFLL